MKLPLSGFGFDMPLKHCLMRCMFFFYAYFRLFFVFHLIRLQGLGLEVSAKEAITHGVAILTFFRPDEASFFLHSLNTAFMKEFLLLDPLQLQEASVATRLFLAVLGMFFTEFLLLITNKSKEGFDCWLFDVHK
tara:strand:- start:5188 stop:5589 length:402 start_codon:yes stop_codon:yes gene_type:complete